MIITENIFDLSAFPSWPRPPKWPAWWSWPVDPTIESAGCDYCDTWAAQGTCDCTNHVFAKSKPRIKRYEETGLGLQAVATSHGQIAHTKGTVIGHITGKIVPLNTRDDSWTLEIVRPDIHEPVCQLDCSEASNCFRLLNHDCNPSALFVPAAVSGRVFITVVARRDIYDGAEITISYGKRYFKGNCRCQTCSKRGRGMRVNSH